MAEDETTASDGTSEDGGSNGTAETTHLADGPEAVEALEALADERRVAILRALYEAESEADNPAELTLSFSELYEIVEVDGTSTFSYHLDQLTGIYVGKGDRGYTLTATGRRVVRAVLVGTYTDLPTFEGVPLEATCPACDRSPVETRCENGILAIVCPECSTPFVRDQVQPAQLVGRTPAQILESYDRKLQHDIALELDGICGECSGQVTLRPERASTQVVLEWLVMVECDRCGKRDHFPPYFALLFEPLVISFYWDHDIDLTSTPIWRVIEFVLSGEWSPEVVDTDPLECRVEIKRDGDELSVTLDEQLRVSDATLRERRDVLPDESSDN
jgi:DNA-binding transcriptional ArsR family regulator